MDLNKQNLIGQGNTAEIYSIGDKKILKLFRKGMGKDAVHREYQNSVAVMTVLDCVPKVYEMVQLDGRDGIIYQQIEGTDMLKTMIGANKKFNDYARKFAQYHIAMQKNCDDNILTVKKKLEEDIHRVDRFTDAQKDKIIDYLKRLPDGNSLCHFDFHPGNIMLQGSEFCILDWMTACVGDPCADVMRTSILLQYGEYEHIPWLMKIIVTNFQKHLYKIYIDEYLSRTGRRIEEIERWQMPVAAARLSEWIPDKEKNKLYDLVLTGLNEL